MRVLGVDPGNGGALVVLTDGHIETIKDMPTGLVRVGARDRNRIIPTILSQLIWEMMPLDKAFVEEVHALPKQGVSSSFAFGQGHGLVLGTLAALKVPTERITPPAWRKAVNLKGGKDAARVRAAQLWPYWAGEFQRVKDDGRAEAALIAHAGCLLFN